MKIRAHLKISSLLLQVILLEERLNLRVVERVRRRLDPRQEGSSRIPRSGSCRRAVPAVVVGAHYEHEPVLGGAAGASFVASGRVLFHPNYARGGAERPGRWLEDRPELAAQL